MAVRVLVIDDSVVVRKLLADALASCAEVQVVGTASSGTTGLAKIPRLNPDLVTLDIEMPGLDGIQTLAEIRKRHPKLPVIMFSTLTERGAAVTLEGLSLGASDYMPKPGNQGSLTSALEQLRGEFIAKVVSLAGPRRAGAVPASARVAGEQESPRQQIGILAIGTSTGGPNALAELIPRLPGSFPVPVLVVQHMPPLFTRLLAERLNSRSQLSVREAEAGQALGPGQVWIARGDYHMTVAREGTEVVLNLNQDPPQHSCRPAVDTLFRSVATVYGSGVLGLVMTGMGSDGAHGAVHIREAGGEILVQDEASSVVWGMPRAVVDAGAADKICSLNEISLEIIRRVTASRLRRAGTAAIGK